MRQWTKYFSGLDSLGGGAAGGAVRAARVGGGRSGKRERAQAAAGLCVPHLNIRSISIYISTFGWFRIYFCLFLLSGVLRPK